MDRYSTLFLPTLREDPAEAEVVSHRLMFRAGMIRKLAAGIYSYLPMGLRVLRKVERIVREEMNRAGAQEVLLPAVQPADLWKESGRWSYYGPELLRFEDRNGRECCLGPTHEEVITDLVRGQIQSYRQLPVNLYQIQTKFRDEIRPRFGVMRAREFIMKDAYSFDADDAGAEESYRKMYEAYRRIFARCGLEFVAVEADTGAIGGSFSHEFMVLADSGEDSVAACRACGYGANVEKAEVRPPERPGAGSEPGAMELVETPGCRTIEEVCAFLGVEPRHTIKTLLFDTDKGTVAVCVRGDHQVNPIKVKNLVDANTAELASEEVVQRVTGAAVGYAGPVGLSVPVYLDHALQEGVGYVVGANRSDHHYRNAVAGRDFRVAGWADLREIEEGDPCPRCGEPVTVRRGIEVGHIFKLGTKYSETMGATFLDREGRERPFVMGCYGIGVGRTVAAAIEQNHDENGIVWPVPIAPWEVLILPIRPGDEATARAVDQIAAGLEERGVEVLVDDRDERPGVRFKDADLIGVPLRITLGPRGLKEGVAEVKERATGAEHRVPLAEVAAWAAEWVEARRTPA
ncbi:proline--tRNA ligase [Deferrisoma camini]|uniref:proline--tRNA ligase n=1 Tax=Deferrisoma camini TaxID=1035120 RepID=UPI00046D7C29|nr:proline--tRNA ligase [Deferrisoma camini]